MKTAMPMSDAEREKRLRALGVDALAWWAWSDADIRKAERKAARRTPAQRQAEQREKAQAEWDLTIRNTMSVCEVDLRAACLAWLSREEHEVLERKGITT